MIIHEYAVLAGYLERGIRTYGSHSYVWVTAKTLETIIKQANCGAIWKPQQHEPATLVSSFNTLGIERSGEIEGLECSEGFTCVDGFCLADDDPGGRNPLGEDFDPLAETPTLCGQGVFLTVCGSDEYCCNDSCGICAPIGGFCTQEFCGED